jgi:hypothetical protein
MVLWLRNHSLDDILTDTGLIAAFGNDNIRYVNSTLAD